MNLPVIGPDAAIGLAGTLVGAVIGALVSILAVYLTSRQQQRLEAAALERRYQTALSLIQAEIDHNLDVLRDYLRENDVDNARRIAANQSGYEWIASHPSPNWSTVAWTNGLGDLLATVAQDKILKAFALYSNLGALTAATDLAISYHNQNLTYAAISTAFDVQKQLAQKILQSGNPLR